MWCLCHSLRYFMVDLRPRLTYKKPVLLKEAMDVATWPSVLSIHPRKGHCILYLGYENSGIQRVIEVVWCRCHVHSQLSEVTCKTPKGLQTCEWERKIMDYTFIQSMNPGNKIWNSGVWTKKLQIISVNKVQGVNCTVNVIATARFILSYRVWKGATSGEGSWAFPIQGGFTSPHLWNLYHYQQWNSPDFLQ